MFLSMVSELIVCGLALEETPKPLYVAAAADELPIVQRLLGQPGTNVNAGEECLHHSADKL